MRTITEIIFNARFLYSWKPSRISVMTERVKVISGAPKVDTTKTAKNKPTTIINSEHKTARERYISKLIFNLLFSNSCLRSKYLARLLLK